MRTVRQEVMPKADAVKADVVKKVASSELTYTELGPMSVNDYLSTPESKDYEELHYGWLMREGCPATAHQAVAGDIYRALWSYVVERRLGFVVQHVDVILDKERRLVVGPDLVVVLNERSNILREQVWGAPNLTVEVLSPTNRGRDRVRKLAWYREYGVHEYWIADPAQFTIEVFDLEAEPTAGPRVYGEADVLESRAIEGFRHPVARFFEYAYDYFREAQTGCCLTDRPMPSTPDANADGPVRYDTDPA